MINSNVRENTLTQKFLDNADTAVTTVEAVDKTTKLAKTVITMVEELNRYEVIERSAEERGKWLELLPVVQPISQPLVALTKSITSVNKVCMLLQPGFRLREYNSREGWGRGAAYLNKAFLTVGQLLEVGMFLQAINIIPVAQNLFTIANRYTVFQSVSGAINYLPCGKVVLSTLFKLSGLEMIKNGCMLASSGFGLKKVWAAMPEKLEKVEKANHSLRKWEEIQLKLTPGFEDRQIASVLLEGSLRKKIVDRFNEQDDLIDPSTLQDRKARNKLEKLNQFVAGVSANGNITAESPQDKFLEIIDNPQLFVESQVIRLRAKKHFAVQELAKAKRSQWNEYFKISIITTGVIGKLTLQSLNLYFNGVFAALQLAGGIFGVYRVIRDSKWEAEKATYRPGTWSSIAVNHLTPTSGVDDEIINQDDAQVLTSSSSDDEVITNYEEAEAASSTSL